MTTRKAEDSSLVQAALEGREEAFDELARRYRKAVFGITFSRLGDYEAALDATQDALVIAWQQLPMLRDPSRFATWLYAIASNTALTRLRRRRNVFPLDLPGLSDIPASGLGPMEVVERADEMRVVRQSLSRLPETDRVAVVLHHLSGCSYQAIARLLGLTVPAVKARLYRARRRLREEMLKAMEQIGDRLPDIEVTEELLDRVLVRLDAGEHGPIAALGDCPGALPGVPQFTRRTRDAVLCIAERVRAEGCQWLVAPWHVPDGSPALSMLRSIGFETMLEMPWYERELGEGLPPVSPLPEQSEVRRLTPKDSGEVLALLRATLQEHAPDAIDQEHVRHMITSDHTVPEASLAARIEGRLAAVVLSMAVRSRESWLYEPGTGLILWTEWYPDVVPPPVIAHLLSVSLRRLHGAGLARAVKQTNGSYAQHQDLVPILGNLGFRHVRSLWNLKLRLAPDER